MNAFIKTSCALLALASASASAATLTFQHGSNGYFGGADTTLANNEPDFAFGDFEELSIDASDGGSPNHVLLRFDDLFGTAAGQIRMDDQIVSATLTVNVTSAGSGILFHDMLLPWNEATATWNSFGDGVQTDGVEASVLPFLTIGANTGDANIEQGMLTLDFTDALRRMHNGSVPGYGWALMPFMPNGTNGIDFPSRDNAFIADRPLLTVDIAPVPEPETYAMLLAGLGLIGFAARRRG
jgi:hypothetical protein